MALEVRAAASKRGLNAFIELPWRLYRNEPMWIPTLLFERKRCCHGSAPVRKIL